MFHFNIYKSDYKIICNKKLLVHVHDQFEVVVNFGYGGAVGEQQHSSSSRGATLYLVRIINQRHL